MFSTKLKVAAGMLGVGGLLLATPYVEGSSSILNYDNHCLRILERKQDDSIRHYLGRGTLSDFYFDVDSGEKTFRTSFKVYSYVGPENSVEKSRTDAKENCASIINQNQLLEFIKVSGSAIKKDCAYSLYGPGSHQTYLSPDSFAKNMKIECNVSVTTPACTMDIFTDSYWTIWVQIDKVNLPNWRAVYTAGEAAIKTRLEPLDYCPIEIPFL